MSIGHQKNQEIEALRGIAVLMVIISHSGNLLFWSDAIEKSHLPLWAGVDIFFAISGFVTARAFGDRLRAAHASGAPAFRRELSAFFVRRIFRIIPSAWLWMLVILFLSIVFNTTGVFTSPAANISDLIAVVLNVANFHFSRCLYQTDGALLCGNNGVYWSLSVEEQFYIVFPFLILLKPMVTHWLTTAVVVGFQFALIAMNYKQPFLYLTRFDSIMLGVSIAYFSATRRYHALEPAWIKKSGLNYISAITLLALLLLTNLGVAPIGLPELRPYTMMVSLIGAAIVLLTSYDREYFFPSGWVRNALCYVGTRSFAIYLIHNPVYWFTRELWARIHPGVTLGHNYMWPFIATAAPLIMLLAEANYRFVENPLREKGAQFARRLSPNDMTPSGSLRRVA